MSLVTIYKGQFDSQPLVFAHIWDVAGGKGDLDHIDVICQSDPAKRLRHVLTEADARKVEDALGLWTTCVLVYGEAGITLKSGRLIEIGTFPAHRTRPT